MEGQFDASADSFRDKSDYDVDAFKESFYGSRTVVESDEVRPGVVFDIDVAGRVLGIEKLKPIGSFMLETFIKCKYHS